MSLEWKSIQRGSWFFRWRSYLPLLLLGIVLPALHGFTYPFGSHTWDNVWDMFCLSVSLFGLGIRAFTVGYVPAGTSGRNTKEQIADSLNTTGMYSVVRNPLYLGNFFMGLGVMLFARQWWLGLLYACLFWLYYERIIMAEESYLRAKFGSVYEEYCNRTPVFFPNFGLWRPPDLPFSWKTVLRREYSGLFGVIAAFAFLETVAECVVNRRIVVDKLWAVIFVLGLLIYATLRVIKKKTTWLDVPGR